MADTGRHIVQGMISAEKVLVFSELVLVFVEVIMVLELFGLYPRGKNYYCSYDFSWYDWPFMVFLVLMLIVHLWIALKFLRGIYRNDFTPSTGKIHLLFPLFALFHFLTFGRVFQMLQFDIRWYQILLIVLYRVVCAIHFYHCPDCWHMDIQESIQTCPHDKPIPYEPPPAYEEPPPYSSVLVKNETELKGNNHDSN